MCRFGQRRVICAVHKILGDNAAFHVAVMAAADAQNRFVGAHVKFAGDDGVWQMFLQGCSGCHCGIQRVQIQRNPIGQGAQSLRIHEAAQAGNHRLGELVFACQLGKRVTAEGRSIGAAREDAGVFECNAQQEAVQRSRVFEVQLFLAGLDLVQRRLGNVNMAPLHELRHLTVKEGEQQCANVRTVNVGVGHDDDTVVSQFGNVEVVVAGAAAGLADAGAQGGNQRQDFIAGEQLFVTRFFDVQNLAAQRQDGLEFPVTALLGRAAGGVALDDVDFAQSRVFFLAVGQLAGQAHAIQNTFASRHVAGFAGSFTCACRFNDLADNDLGVVRTLLQVVVQEFADDVFNRAAHFARDQLVFGLAGELGLRHLDGEYAAQAFAHVIACNFYLGFFSQLAVVNVFVDDARHGGAQSGQVGTAVALRNVVGKAKHLFAVTTVPLHRHFNADVGALVALTVAHRVKDVGMQNRFAFVGEVHKAFDTAGAGEVVFFASTLVFEADLHTVVQKAQFAQTFAQNLVMEIVVFFEDVRVWQKVNFSAAFISVTHHLHRRDFDTVDIFKDAVLHKASGKLHGVHLTVATYRQPKHFGQCVNAAHTHTMQTT